MAVERLADRALGQRAPIHAGAERPAGAAHHHDPNRGIARRLLGRVGQARREVVIERVQHARPVQRDRADAVLHGVQDGRFGHGGLAAYRKPRRSRAITMRWTSEVPSPISVSLASRNIRSMGNSVM